MMEAEDREIMNRVRRQMKNLDTISCRAEGMGREAGGRSKYMSSQQAYILPDPPIIK